MNDEITESRLCCVVTLPLPASIANMRGAHWTSKHRAKKDYWELCRAWEMHGRAKVTIAGMPSRFMYDAPPAPDVVEAMNVDATAALFVRGRMDDDNAVATLKWALDFLRATPGAYLRGDRQPALTLAMPRQTIDRRAPSRVVFTLHYVSRT